MQGVFQISILYCCIRPSETQFKNKTYFGSLQKHTNASVQTFFALCVRLHSVEKIPSVQSLVATSSRPNICGAVIAFGFMRISLCTATHSVSAFISTWMQHVFPAPDGPRAIMPCRTSCVSYSWISFSIQGACSIRPNSFTWQTPVPANSMTTLTKTKWCYRSNVRWTVV